MLRTIVEGEPGIFPEPVARVMRRIGGIFGRDSSTAPEPPGESAIDEPRTGEPTGEDRNGEHRTDEPTTDGASGPADGRHDSDTR